MFIPTIIPLAKASHMTKPKVNVVGKYTPPTVGGHYTVTCKGVDVLIFRNAISSFIIQTVTGCGREGGPYQMGSISERDSLSSDNVFVSPESSHAWSWIHLGLLRVTNQYIPWHFPF